MYVVASRDKGSIDCIFSGYILSIWVVEGYAKVFSGMLLK